MRYIKTDTNIWEVVGEKEKVYIVKSIDKKKIYSKSKSQINLLGESDRLEELCDEFVLFIDGKPYAIVPNKEYNAELAHDVWKDYRGAIWTEWGLQFVARMNKEGVLELL